MIIPVIYLVISFLGFRRRSSHKAISTWKWTSMCNYSKMYLLISLLKLTTLSFSLFLSSSLSSTSSSLSLSSSSPFSHVDCLWIKLKISLNSYVVWKLRCPELHFLTCIASFSIHLLFIFLPLRVDTNVRTPFCVILMPKRVFIEVLECRVRRALRNSIPTLLPAGTVNHSSPSGHQYPGSILLGLLSVRRRGLGST